MATSSKVAKKENPIENRKELSDDAKGIVVKVHRYLRDELQFILTCNEGKTDLSHLMNVTKRTAEACGVSESTVCKTLEENNASETGIIDRDVLATNLNVNNCRSFRKTLLEYINEPNADLSLLKIKEILEKKAGLSLSFSVNTLRAVMKVMGFEVKHTKRHHIERPDVLKARNMFLKKMAQFRAEERTIVYAGKLLVYVRFGSQTVNSSGIKEFQDEETKLICIMNAVTRYGFVPMCVSFEEMQLDKLPEMHLDQWITGVLIPNLPKKSVIVLDSDIYERAWSKDRPDTGHTKAQIEKYLSVLELPNLNCHNKVELMKMIENNLHKIIDYKVSRQVRSQGYEILPLPPYHKELNAMEIVCELVKKPLETSNVHAPEVMNDVMNKTVSPSQLAEIFDDIEILEHEYAIYSGCIQDEPENNHSINTNVPAVKEEYGDEYVCGDN